MSTLPESTQRFLEFAAYTAQCVSALDQQLADGMISTDQYRGRLHYVRQRMHGAKQSFLADCWLSADTDAAEAGRVLAHSVAPRREDDE